MQFNFMVFTFIFGKLGINLLLLISKSKALKINNQT